MESLNEIAAWIHEEMAVAKNKIQKADVAERKYLALTIALHLKFLDRLKQAGHNQEKRRKRALRGFWNQHDWEGEEE